MKTTKLCLLLVHLAIVSCSSSAIRKRPQKAQPKFRCLRNYGFNIQGRLIDLDQVCDGWFDCKDLSDEYLCPLDSRIPEKSIRNFHDKFSRHMKKFVVNATYQNRVEYMEEFFKAVSERNSRPFTGIDFSHYDCRNEKMRQESVDCKICKAGEILCPDFKLGENPWYTTKPMFMKDITSRQSEGSGAGETVFKQCVTLDEVCDHKIDCKYGEDEMFCRSHNVARPSGSPLDGAQLSPRSSLFQLSRNSAFSPLLSNHFRTVVRRRQVRSTEPTIKCEEIARTHLDTVLQTKFKIFKRRNPPQKYITYIKKQMNQLTSSEQEITMDAMCDGKFDCEERSDEIFCPGRFYCQTGKVMFIDQWKMMDGKADCTDGSDEWSRRMTETTMASKDNMIKNVIFVIFIWIIGSVAFIGNIIVIFSSILELMSLRINANSSKIGSVVRTLRRTLKKQAYNTDTSIWNRKKMVKYCNLILVLNLASADFLMSLYLLTLGGVTSTNWGGSWEQNQYWKMDVVWRTSSTCKTLGVMVMSASLTSIYTLFGLTTMRLHTVVKPFSTKLLNPKRVVMFCVVIWTIAITLSFVPLMPSNQSLYASEAWVPLPHFKPPIINQTSASETMRALLAIVQTNITFKPEEFSWLQMAEVVSSVAPEYANLRVLGFYSAHSVCIPRLYASPGENAWQYTVFFLSVNFLIAVYISIAYAVIYTKTKSQMVTTNSSSSINSVPSSATSVSNGQRRSSDQQRSIKYQTLSQMQSRITILVVTDCLCWLPICIMCFLNLSSVEIPAMAYYISAVILLPINSALNPVLYSKFTKDLWNKVKNVLSRGTKSINRDPTTRS